IGGDGCDFKCLRTHVLSLLFKVTADTLHLKFDAYGSPRPIFIAPYRFLLCAEIKPQGSAVNQRHQCLSAGTELAFAADYEDIQVHFGNDSAHHAPTASSNIAPRIRH